VVNPYTYFKHLCATESGRWNYAPVETDVIFDMRPSYRVDPVWMFADRYYLEDPTHLNIDGVLGLDPKASYPKTQTAEQAVAQSATNYWTSLDLYGFDSRKHLPIRDVNDVRRFAPFNAYDPRVASRAYEMAVPEAWRDRYPGFRYLRITRKQPQALEYLPAADGGRVLAYKRREEETSQVVTPVNEITSRYGFSWRAIERSGRDRELGIAGSEWAVFDMKTGEPVALQRTFVFTTLPGPNPATPRFAHWDTVVDCPGTVGHSPVSLMLSVRRRVVFHSEH
jgi:hypothetical protein